MAAAPSIDISPSIPGDVLGNTPEDDLVNALAADVAARRPGGDRPLFPIDEIKLWSRGWHSAKIPHLPGSTMPSSVGTRSITSDDIKASALTWPRPLVVEILREFSGRVILAGGAALEMVLGLARGFVRCPSDHDFFVIASTAEKAAAIRTELLAFIVENMQASTYKTLKEQVASYRSRRTPPGHRNFDTRIHVRVMMRRGTTTIDGDKSLGIVQVIHRLNENPADVLYGFDLGSCAVGVWYDADGLFHVCASEMGRFALTYGMNVLDPTRASTTYAVRINKFIGRGFGIILPEVDPGVFEWTHFRGMDGHIQRKKLDREMGPFVLMADGLGQELKLVPRTLGDRSDYDVDEGDSVETFNHSVLRRSMNGDLNARYHVHTDINEVGSEYGVSQRFSVNSELLIRMAQIDVGLFASKALTVGPHVISERRLVLVYDEAVATTRSNLLNGKFKLRELRRFLPGADVLPVLVAMQAGREKKVIAQQVEVILDQLRSRRDAVIGAARRIKEHPTEWPHLTPAAAQGFRLTGSFRPLALTPEEMGGKIFRRHPRITPLFENVLPLAMAADGDAADEDAADGDAADGDAAGEDAAEPSRVAP